MWSNFINDILFFLKPLINIPLDIIPMALLRPISGTATLAIMQNIFSLYGPDSFIGYLASTLQGCTDTTIYVLALYFGSIKIYKTRYALIVGLFADLIGIISAIVIVSFYFNWHNFTIIIKNNIDTITNNYYNNHKVYVIWKIKKIIRV